jgi:hypothetical protein
MPGKFTDHRMDLQSEKLGNWSAVLHLCVGNQPLQKSNFFVNPESNPIL